ncbi:hypothetical protein OQJ18_13925 [Fluoribacter dumoffii]|uniref:Uncharacterized protein n=1 Tax=Fluoribacter dumoffii TaxID=463 RepID=A0A377GDH9_9GAMM|nr:hypothetical protein [Fluoribacter dumoffii]KTC91181.1 hypothetical protein Ldum_2249 [Fluoribacter dumoffii NY 23]MCW8387651.1 hypothetical protein [Fluoribacter dumoffii]MCW8416804.1 hypothetical protein [Fluoribacter dumoffii]MCW8455356.1 hypothetical protein [Fluoribacter dumoffii]MCW8460566.1 hypothetical protein [Fluoribacter dumoffii]
MESKIGYTKEAQGRKRSKLEPPFDAGDCGYYAFCVGLLHLGMQAKQDPAVAETLNSSKPLSELFSNMRMLNRFTGSDNVQTINNIVTELGSSSWDRLSFREVLADFSDGMRVSLLTSDLGVDYFKNMIKEGAWVIDNQKWMDLPQFKKLNRKILDRMQELAVGTDVSIERAGELRFQATLEIFKNLSEEVLEDMAKEVIKKYYGPGSKKAWLDADFLKNCSRQLFPKADNLFFDPQGIEITSKGPTDSHWYIDVPKNQTTDSLLSSVNAGASKDLKEIEVYRVKDAKADPLSALLKEQKDLLQAKNKALREFKEMTSGLFAKYIDKSFSEVLSDLCCFESEPPDQESLDTALLPLYAEGRIVMQEYTELTVARKAIEMINEKLKSVEKELESKKDKASVSSLITGGLSFQQSKEKQNPDDKPQLDGNNALDQKGFS